MKTVKTREEVRGPFAEYFRKCANCRHFDKEDQSFTASNRRECKIDSREHWAGDAACQSYDTAR